MSIETPPKIVLTEKGWFFRLFAFLLLVLALMGSARIALAQTVSSCAQYYTVSTTGSPAYNVQTNYWNQGCGGSGTQCVTINTSTGAFTATGTFSCAPNVASYPSIYYGCHYGDCSPGTNLPMLVSGLTCVTSSWNFTPINSGSYDIAYDIWFSTTTNTSGGYNGGAELMIWLNYMGNAPPAGTLQASNVSIDGMTFNIYEGNIGWNYIAYMITSNITSVTNMNVLDFINDSVSRGFINTGWYLAAIEAGIEFRSGGVPFATNSFSAAVNSGCSAGATPTFTNSPTKSPTPTPTNTATLTRTNTPANTATNIPTRTPTATFTNTVQNTPTNTATRTATLSPTNTPSNSPTQTPTRTATNSPTNSPTNTPAVPTNTPTNSPTNTSTNTPTRTATLTPTNSPSNSPTQTPTRTPTNTLTNTPSNTNTNSPTNSPSATPTRTPSLTPTLTPTDTPTSTSTVTSTSTNSPTGTLSPSDTPTSTSSATNSPTLTASPTTTSTSTTTGTNTSTRTPTNSPTNTASDSPTLTASLTPSNTPTNSSTLTVTATATNSPANTVTLTPSNSPTNSPTWTPSNSATNTPLATATVTSTTVTLSVVSGPSIPSNSNQLPGTSNLPVAQIMVTNPGTVPVTLTSLTITDGGTGNPVAGISGITLKNNGTSVGTATFGGASATFTSLTVVIPPSGGVTLQVNASFANNAPGGTYQFSVTGVVGTSGQAVNFNGLPYNAATITLVAATSTPSATPTAIGNGKIIIYPNPAPGGTVNVIPPPYSGQSNVRIEFFTTAFRKVQDATFPDVLSGTGISIPLTDKWGAPLASGLYYVVVNSSSGRSIGKLLILK